MLTPTAQVWFFFFLHIGVILVASAYFTLSAALAPQLTRRARMRFAQRPWLPAIIGIALSVPWVIASILLLRMGFAPAKFAGVLLGCLWILLGLIGGAGIAQQIGRGAASDTGEACWIHSVRGGLFITLTWVLPFIGWLGMLPLTLATGIGCLVVGIFPMAQRSRYDELPLHAAPAMELGHPHVAV